MVGGAPRSGTTVTHAFLCTSSHTNAYHPETNFLRPLFAAYRGGIEMWSGTISNFFPDQATYRHFMNTVLNLSLKQISSTLKSPEVLCLKDPDLSPLFHWVDDLLSKQVRFVTVVRHPYDVLRSHQEVLVNKGAGFSESDAVRLSKNYLNCYAHLSDPALRDKLYCFRYEDLNLESVQDDLRKFTGFDDLDPSRTWSETRAWSGEKSLERSVAKDPWFSPKYHGEIDLTPRLSPLSEPYRKVANSICGPIMEKFDYPATPSPQPEQRAVPRRQGRGSAQQSQKHFFIHIGKPRTATTSFQTGICKAADKLKEAGLCVPKSGRAGDRHMQLVWASSPETVARLHPWHRNNYDGRSVEDHVEMVIDEAKDQPAILLSSEWFSIFPDLCFSGMVDAFSRHGEVTALVALRDQADTVYSSFMQQLQAKSLVPPFERFGPRWAEYGKSDAPLDHHVLLRNWSSMCRVRAFWFGPQICERIMAETGFPDIAEFQRENSSVPFELSGFVRAEAEKPYKPAEWNTFIEAIRKDSVQFAEHADPALLEAADSVRARIRSQFADSNARLEAEFGHLII